MKTFMFFKTDNFMIYNSVVKMNDACFIPNFSNVICVEAALYN